MRKLAIATMLASAAFVAGGSVHAATVTLPVQGSGSLGISDALTGSMNLLVSAYPGLITIPEAPPSSYIPLSFTSATVDTGSNALQALWGGGNKGVGITAQPLKSVSTGGSITITDLSVDVIGQHVYATVNGANGVGSLTNFNVWNFMSTTGATSLSNSGASYGTFDGLYFTQDGLTKVAQALGMQSLGKASLGMVQDVGSISWSVTSVVPEPGTWALTLLGLGAMGVTLRKRRQA